MSDEHPDRGWPREAGDIEDLAKEIEPRPELEARVIRALEHRGLLGASRRPAFRRRLLPVAASVLLFVIGFGLGRTFQGHDPVAAEPEASYALLLYEGESFEAVQGAGLLDRYDEYSRWVAEARGRGQFRTGIDLSVDRGWVLRKQDRNTLVEDGVAVDRSALSGVFLITARNDDRALALAEALPHLRHGGHVVVQRVVPTDDPPVISEDETGKEEKSP